jgi:hypothetical protein
MHKEYEAPQLTVVGAVNDIVMGSSIGALDNGQEAGADFEFLPDWPII